MTKKRQKPAVRRETILDAALVLARRHGYKGLTRDAIAKQAGVAGSTVQYHFGTVAKLQRDIMRHAIKTQDLAVVAQGLVLRDAHALKAPEELRVRARESTL